MAFEIGQVAGGYEFVEAIENARGDATFKVRNVLADRFELLRIIPKGAEEGREPVERFLREIKVHARLVHPIIVTFYNALEIDGKLVMTCEFFESVTLEDRLQSGRMLVTEAIGCVSQILAALGYAHDQGVTHREVSPANVLIGPDGAVKLTGFGLAKAASDPQLPRAGMVMGWIDYMAPEQVKGLATMDGRADLYATGVVLYEMMTGSVPFTGKSQFDVMMAHVNAQPEPPILLNSDLSPDLNQIILTALAKDPDKRYRTAALFRAALNQASTAPARPVEMLPTAPASMPAGVVAEESWGFERLVFTGLLTFVVVAIAFFAYLKMIRP